MRSQCEGLFLSVQWYFRFLFLLLLFLCRFPVGRTTRRMLQFISAAKIDTMRGRGGSDDGSCKEIFWVWVLGSVRVFVYVSFCSANWDCRCVFVYLFVSVFYLWWWVRCLSGKHTQKKTAVPKEWCCTANASYSQWRYANVESVLEKVWCFDVVKRISYLCPFVLRSTIQPICISSSTTNVFQAIIFQWSSQMFLGMHDNFFFLPITDNVQLLKANTDNTHTYTHIYDHDLRSWH